MSSRAVKVTLDLNTGLGNKIINNPGLLRRNLCKLATVAQEEWNIERRILGREGKPIDESARACFVDMFIKDNYLKGIKCGHTFDFVRVFKPVVRANNMYLVTRPPGRTILGSTPQKVQITVRLDPSTTFITDQALRVKTGPIPALAGVRYQWTHFPGIRLIRRASVTVARAQLEEYVRDDIMIETNEMLRTDNRTAWYQSVGEDVGTEGRLYNTSLEVDQSQIFYNGLQTFKYNQDGLDIFIPLRFFYNKDIQSALQVSNIDNNIIEINIEFATIDEMVRGLIDATGALGPNTANPTPTYTTISQIELQKLEVWTNCIICEQRVHDILIDKTVKRLVSIREHQNSTTTDSQGMLKLDMIRHLVEDIMVCAEPTSLESDFENWWRCGIVTEVPYCGVMIIDSAPPQIVIRDYLTYQVAPVFDEISLTTKGEKTSDFMPAQFYNTYLPYVRGFQRDSAVIKAPGQGVFMWSWAQIVGDAKNLHSESNFTREREVQLEWRTADTKVSPTNAASIHILAHVKAVLMNCEGAANIYFQ